MLGQPVSFTLPQVVGCKLVGSINTLATSIDIVLGITKVHVLCFLFSLIRMGMQRLDAVDAPESRKPFVLQDMV